MKIAEALRTEEALYAQMKVLNDQDDALLAQGTMPIGFGDDVGKYKVSDT